MSVARATAAADDNRSKHQLDATAKSVPCAATTSSNNPRLLDYDRAFAEELPIATSLIETGAVPDPTSRSGRSSILRCILLNGQWDQFPGHLARRGLLQLAATPTPTTAQCREEGSVIMQSWICTRSKRLPVS
jgi:hypothetical protein